MSSSSSNTSLTAAVNNVKQSMALCIQIWSYCLLVLGIIGHGLNMFVFTRPKFHRNPCARYFLATTVSGCGVVFLSVLLRMLQISYRIDAFAYSNLSCQTLSYVLASNRVLPSWFIVLASMDRFLCSSSSVRLRGWSSIRVANRSILFIVFFIFLIYIHLPLNYAVLLPQRSCVFASSSYQAFFAVWNLFFWSWIPSTLMLIFGLLIIRHIRQGKRRIAPQNQRQGSQKKIDRQLIQMLLFQSLVLALTTTMASVGNLYISISTKLMAKNALDTAIDNYLSNTANYMALSGPCLSFYIFTLSSRLFRKELLSAFRWRMARLGVGTLNTRLTS